MTRSARPENWQDLLAGYTLGNLNSEEVEALQQLLTEHPELTAEVDRFQEVLALIPYDVPEQDPPAHLKAAILSAAQADYPRLPGLPPPTSASRSAATASALPQRRSWLRELGVGGAIAAAAILALGIDNYRLRQEISGNQSIISALQQEVAANRPIVAALQQPGTSLYSLEGTQNAVQASGSIVVTLDQEVLIVARNLPQLPQGNEYRLWAMSANSKKPTYCGQFNTGPAGTISTLWSASEAQCSADPSQLLITAELASDPLTPKGDLVMKSRG